MSQAKGRSPAFVRNAELEALLKDLNASLWTAEKKLLEQRQPARFPMIFVMGPLRSGTTLFMQWLANTGLAACPTNLLSRFYQAPVIGAKIQLLLTDPRYNFRDELGEFARQAEYGSENGKTRGALAPNEFWYFWRRFLSEPERDIWTDDELRQSMDTRTMLAELAGMMDVFGKPFAAKGMLFNYNIPFLDSIVDKALFVQVRRDPATNAASVLEARKRQFGSDAHWYSFRIPEYDQLENLDPIAQAAGQVSCINRAVANGMAEVAEHRKLLVQYEDFCTDPRQVFMQLIGKLGVSHTYHGPAGFRATGQLEPAYRSRIETALAAFEA